MPGDATMTTMARIDTMFDAMNMHGYRKNASSHRLMSMPNAHRVLKMRVGSKNWYFAIKIRGVACRMSHQISESKLVNCHKIFLLCTKDAGTFNKMRFINSKASDSDLVDWSCAARDAVVIHGTADDDALWGSYF